MAVTTEPSTAAYSGPYDLSEEQETFRRTLREFVTREIVPIAQELDEREEFPRASIARMAELGLLGLTVPDTYGGAGGSTMEYVLAMEEVSWGDASHSVVVSVQNSLVCDPILKFGSEIQRATYLPALASGASIGAYCLTSRDRALTRPT